MEALERQRLVLDAVRRVLHPLLRLLMDEGIGYQTFLVHMKPVFIEQALAQVQERGEKDTDSALSLRSGVQRKEIAAWRLNPVLSKKAVKRSIPGEVYARWISDASYQTESGSPLQLPRVGPEPSFEALARSVNQVVHPLSVLNELIRLGLAQLAAGPKGEEQVCLTQAGFVPQSDLTDLLELFVDNLSAHVETAAFNLRGEKPKHLEQAAYAGGLTQTSAQHLSELSRELWSEMLKVFLAEARRLHTQDQGEGNHLVRFGAYFHDGSTPPDKSDV